MNCLQMAPRFQHSEKLGLLAAVKLCLCYYSLITTYSFYWKTSVAHIFKMQVLSLYSSRLIMAFLKDFLKYMISAFSFSNAITLKGFRKSLVRCCDTSREMVVWVITLLCYIVKLTTTWLIFIRGMRATFSEKQKEVLWVQLAPSRKLDGYWRRKKRGLCTC